MKKRISVSLIALIAVCNIPLMWSQERLEERGINPATHVGMPRYVADEVVVKFNTGTSQRSARSISEIGMDKVLAAFDVKEMKQLLPDNHPGRTMRSAPAFTGETVMEVDLSSLYLLKVNLKEDQDLGQILSELKVVPEVEYAEPNFLYYTCGVAADYKAEPMYSQQWGIPRVKLDQLWTKPVINNKRPVIAIIDTGVDVTHPDLAPNIWTNEDEIPGDGLDNDNNGYVDDVHGWDFVNNSPKIVDGFGHGTHCAGIAAACGTNKIGITGGNPDALIMPVSVLQSNGSGDMASIVKAVRYAVDNGAEILSMSFGSTENSKALQQALQQAYQSAILVAAAGNESLGIDAACGLNGRPAFPGGYSFVLGVMATQETKGTNGYRTSFSNFDCDGPVKTSYPEGKGYNYELSAPGAKILSTVPGGKYQSWNGTSMATPLVAGGISRLLQVSDYSSQERLWGDLIHTSGDNVDFEACYEVSERHPVLTLLSVQLDDEGGDGDNSPDAGEVIAIYPKLLNTGGVAVDIQMKIECAEFEDTTAVELLDSVVDFGSTLSTYEKRQSIHPLRVRMSP
ncbi:MAG: S8 family peptidase, partial [Bacteroidales bacterium]|nr:S8 family peptidase [Bacteroidales bacterium]